MKPSTSLSLATEIAIILRSQYPPGNRNAEAFDEASKIVMREETMRTALNEIKDLIGTWPNWEYQDLYERSQEIARIVDRTADQAMADQAEFMPKSTAPGYTVNDRRGENKEKAPLPCRVCGSSEPHSLDYNKPTMECIKFLRGKLLTKSKAEEIVHHNLAKEDATIDDTDDGSAARLRVRDGLMKDLTPFFYS